MKEKGGNNKMIANEDRKTVYYTENEEYQAGCQDQHYLIIIDANGGMREMDLALFGKQRILIGRDAYKNDIELNSKIVSSCHGKFKFIDGTLHYADLGSTNGTTIEDGAFDKLLKGNQKYYPLREGSVLKIQLSSGSGEDTVLMLYTRRLEDGIWRKYSVELPEIRIGRSVENDIVLTNPSVSRIHAILKKNGEDYEIQDNRSLNGIMINAHMLNGTRVLREKDVIQIFNSKLIYTRGIIYYKNSMQGISLNVSNVNKFVGKQKKQILNNVNCEIDSNEFVAIIGGSGAGKSTLMNAISGFDKNMVGEVYCNGADLHQNFNSLKSMIGYVPQQDIIYENLTLRTMLYYTAKMKMPSDTTKEEIAIRIDKVLAMVELQEHQNTYIRKLSGGQKKRASIAVELLADPSLFFLDEPTSGLDPGTEKKLMQTLSKLSKTQGKTIIMVTHTTQNLHLCDKVIFMGPGGYLCFCGTTEQAKMFFDTDDLVNIYNMIAENPQMWATQFANCMEYTGAQRNDAGTIDTSRKRVNLFRQMAILTARYGQLIINDRQRLLMLVLQPILIALLLSLVAADDVFEIYDGTKSILFALSCACIWIGLFNSIQEICKERVILKREYMANLKLTAYIFSKYVIQILIGLVQALLMTLIFLQTVGKPEKGILFDNPAPEIFLVLWMTILASMALGFVISGMVKSGDKAMVIAPFVLIVQLLFSGILFELKGIGDKIAYGTISKWSIEGLGGIANLNELTSKLQKEMPTYQRDFEEMFESTKGHLAVRVDVLGVYVVLCAVISIIVLKSVSKDSR